MAKELYFEINTNVCGVNLPVVEWPGFREQILCDAIGIGINGDIVGDPREGVSVRLYVRRVKDA